MKRKRISSTKKCVCIVLETFAFFGYLSSVSHTNEKKAIKSIHIRAGLPLFFVIFAQKKFFFTLKVKKLLFIFLENTFKLL